MKKNYKKEVQRALMHMIVGIVIVLLAAYLGATNATIILGMILILGLITSMISRKKKLPIIYPFLKRFERSQEFKTFPGKGSFYFVTGCFLSLFAFEKNIALASIMILAFGDSFTNIFGPFGKIITTLHSKKKIEGTAMGILIGTLGAMWFVSPAQAFFGSLVAMFAELIDFEYLQVNDNVLIPLIAGIVMMLFV